MSLMTLMSGPADVSLLQCGSHLVILKDDRLLSLAQRIAHSFTSLIIYLGPPWKLCLFPAKHLQHVSLDIMSKAISEPTVPQAMGQLRVIHSALLYSEFKLFSVTNDHSLPGRFLECFQPSGKTALMRRGKRGCRGVGGMVG